MKTRPLGQTGPQVSAIGLGCMSFAGFFGPTDEPTSHATLDAAWDAGITFLDTAEIYGRGLSESIIGSYLKKRGHPFHIATKGGIRIDDSGRAIDNSPEYLRAALEGSLKRLGVDHVALYYIHRREQTRAFEDMVGTLQRFIEEGKIGGYGLSEVSPTSLRRAHAIHPCMAVQSEYSLWTRLPELGLIQECERLGTTFVPFSPVGRSMLTDSPVTQDNIAESDFRRTNPRFMEPNYSDNLRQIAGFQAFARSRGWTTSAAALAWILDKVPSAVPIPATRTPDHLKDWNGAAEISFTDEDRAEIDRLLPIGWAWGDRYNAAQWVAPEKYA